MRHAALTILLVLLLLPAARGQRFKPDPVEKLKRILTDDYKLMQTNIARVGLREARATYTKKLQEAIDGIGKSVSDTSRALLLLEWNRPKLSPSARPGDFDLEVNLIEGPARTKLLARFIQTVGGSLETDSVARQVAICNLISETLSGSGDPLSDEELVKDLNPLAKALNKLAKSDAPAEVRVAAARALGRFFTEVEVAADAWKPMLRASEPPAVRRAAAESIEAMLFATSGVERLTASEPGVSTREKPLSKTSISRDALAKMATVLIPLAGTGAADEEVAVRLPAVRALQEAASALEETVKTDASRLADLVGKRVTETTREDIIYTLRVQKQVDQAALEYVAQAAVLRARVFDPDPVIRAEARKMVGALGRLRLGLIDLGQELGKLREDLGDQFPSEKKEEKEEKKKKDDTGAIAVPSGLRFVAADDDPPAPKRKEKDKEKKGKPELMPGAAKLDEMLRDLVARVANAATMDPDVKSRRAAAEGVESLGELGAPLVPGLIRMLKDEDLFVRWIAARALGKLGDDAASAVPSLITMTADEDQDARMAAITALGKIGPEAKDAVPTLIQRLKAGDAEVRLSAIRALEGIGEASEAALPTLVGLFEYSDSRIRSEAAALVGRFGSRAKPYVPTLRKLVEDRDSGVRRSASAAILAIGD
jgi:HEAT repeat protein